MEGGAPATTTQLYEASLSSWKDILFKKTQLNKNQNNNVFLLATMWIHIPSFSDNLIPNYFVVYFHGSPLEHALPLKGAMYLPTFSFHAECCILFLYLSIHKPTLWKSN